MFLYFVRHGESVNNLLKKWTGWADVPLSPKGEQDAKKAGELLKNVSFDKVYSSDLCRAINTAKIALPNCVIETIRDIREINVGTLMGNVISLTDEQRDLTRTEGYSSFGGESRADFRKRIVDFIKMTQTLDCENVVAFAHGGVLRMALDIIVGIDLPPSNICCNNCAVAVFEYADEKWRLHSWIN